MCGLCLLIFAVVLFCFPPSAFSIEAVLSFSLCGSPWIFIICWVAKTLLSTMYILSFFPIETGSFFNTIVLMLYLAWILWTIFKREFPY